MPDDRYDLIIVGSGPGGASAAQRLAATGKRILLIERGPYLPRERENWDTEEVFGKARYQTHEVWKSSNGDSFHPGLHYWVGGNSKMYGAALFRLRETDFHAVRHVDGVAPEWPLKYDVFAPYYDEAEQLYQVHGARGEDPTEPPSDRPYPKPPVSHEPRIARLADDLPARACTRSICPSAPGSRRTPTAARARICRACAATRSTAIPASPMARPTRRWSASTRP